MARSFRKLLKDWGIDPDGDYPPGALLVFEYDLANYIVRPEKHGGPPLGGRSYGDR